MLDKTWNKFVGCIMEARDIWDKHQEELLLTSVKEIEEMSPEVQKILSVFRRTKFEVMLPRFMDYARGWGGFEEMLVVEGKEEEVMVREPEVEELEVIGSIEEEEKVDKEETNIEKELRKGGKEK